MMESSKKIIAMEGQRVGVSDLGYAAEWLLDVWIQKARADHSRSSDPDEQGCRAAGDHRQENAGLGPRIPLHSGSVGGAARHGVADPVLNYMQQTYIEEQRRQQSVEDWDRSGMWGPYDW